MARVEEHIADGRVLALIRSYLEQGVMDDLRYYEAGEDGTPQGSVLTPWTHLVSSSFRPDCR